METADRKLLNPYINRLKNKLNREPVVVTEYKEDLDSSDVVILDNQLVDELITVWNKLNYNGLLVYNPKLYSFKINQFRKTNKISSPIMTVSDSMCIIKKEKYDDRNKSETPQIINKLVEATQDYPDVVPVPDYRKSDLKEEYLEKYCEPGYFICISDDDVETPELINKSRVGFSKKFILLADIDKYRESRIYYNYDPNVIWLNPKEPLDIIRKMCHNVKKLEKEPVSLWVNMKNDHMSHMILELITKEISVSTIFSKFETEFGEGQSKKLHDGLFVKTVFPEKTLKSEMRNMNSDHGKFLNIREIAGELSWDI